MDRPPPVRLELSASPALAAAILTAHAAAAACAVLVLAGWQAPGAAAAILLMGGLAAWRGALLRGASAPRGIELLGPGQARILYRGGRTAPAVAVGGSGVTRWWVALRIPGGFGAGALVTAGMLGGGLHRALRLWALWGRMPPVAPRQLRA